MNLLVAAKVSDFKLTTILEPIIHHKEVDKIFLVRRFPLKLSKVHCYCPPKLFRPSRILSDLWRFMTILWLCTTKPIHLLIGIHFIYHGVFVALAGIVFGKPYVCSIIEDPVLYRDDSLFRFFMRRARMVFVRGNQSKKLMQERFGVDSSRVRVLCDLIDMESIIRSSQSITDKSYHLVFAGEFAKAKRLDILIEAVGLMKDSRPDIRLLLVGDGAFRPMVEQLIDRYQLKNNITLAGHIENQRLPEFLSQGRILVMTSETEGLPVVMIEALACGLPIVASNVGDISDIARSENSILLDRPVAEDISDACLKLLNDEDRLEKFSLESRRIANEIKSRYTLEALSSNWKEVLHD